MFLNQVVAERIKEILKVKNLTQYKLSQLSGVPQSTLSTILKCEVKTVTLATIYDICSGVGIELYQFFNSKEFMLENIID